MDTMGHPLAPHVTPASEQELARVDLQAEAIRRATSGFVELAYVDRDYTGEEAFDEAMDRGIILDVIKMSGAK